MSTPEQPEHQQSGLSFSTPSLALARPSPAVAVLAGGKLLDSGSTIIARSLDPSLVETSAIPATMHATLGIPLGSLLVCALTIALVATVATGASRLLDAIAAWTGVPAIGGRVRAWSLVFAGVAFASLAVQNTIVVLT